MPTQYCVLQTVSGLAVTNTTLRVQLFAVGGDTELYTSDTVVERTNAKTQYVASFGEVTAISAGTYFALLSVVATGVVLASGERVFVGTDGETAAGQLQATAVTVTPLSAGDIQRVTGTTIEAFVNEVAPITVYAITDADGVAVDLDALALTVHIEDQHHAVVESIADPTISGVDDNDFTFTPGSATVAQARQLIWSLRVNSTDYVLAHGVFDIKYAARGE